MSCVTLYFLLLFILFPSVLSSLIKLLFFLFIISMFLYVKLFVQQKSDLFRLLQKKSFSLFSFPSKNIVFSVSFFVGFLKKPSSFFHVWFFCVLKNDFSFCISLLFLLHLLNTVSLFYLKYQKKNVVLAGKWSKNCRLFSVSVLLVSKTCCVRKNPFYFCTIFDFLY